MIFRLVNIATDDPYWNHVLQGTHWDPSALQQTHWHRFMCFLDPYVSNRTGSYYYCQ